MSAKTLVLHWIRPVLALALCLFLSLPALAQHGGGGGGGGVGGGGGGGADAAEASQAADDARDAAEAAVAAVAMTTGQAGGEGAPAAAELSQPGQGLTASSDKGTSAGVSAVDRAALDAVSVNRAAWSPF